MNFSPTLNVNNKNTISLESVKAIIAEGESQTVEFKKSTTQLRAAFETITAFLNGAGGMVLIGVNDNGKIIGQEISDNTKLEIARELTKIEPTSQVAIDYVDLSETKKVIVLTVKKGAHVPYAYDGRAFQRSQSSTGRMSQHRYEQLIVERGQLNHSWEACVTDKYDIDSLDHDQIYKVVSVAVNEGRIPASALKSSVNDILSRYMLTDSGKLKNAAVVLFVKKDALNLPQCIIKMARFRGNDKLGEIIDSKHVYANAFTILDEADSFLRKHLMIASFFDKNQFQRIDEPTLPVLAVREALVNAVCHRDYSSHSGSIMLAIYDERMELWNNGKLPTTLNVDDLSKRHLSYATNPLIAGVFHSMRLIETWGTGTNRMIEFCTDIGLPAPEFKEEFGGLSVIFTFKESIGVSAGKARTTGDSKTTLHPRKRREKIILLLKQSGALSAKEVHSELKIGVSFRTIKTDLLALQKQGAIKQIGKGKNTLWQII